MQRTIARGAQKNIPRMQLNLYETLRGWRLSKTNVARLLIGRWCNSSYSRRHTTYSCNFWIKIPSNLHQLATLQEEGVGQIGWDFERFRQNRIRINGRIFEPSQVKISRNITDWYGVAPPDLRLKPEDIEKIQSGFQGFQIFHGLVSNDVLEDVAKRLLELRSSGSL